MTKIKDYSLVENSKSLRLFHPCGKLEKLKVIPPLEAYL
jgi:hypothetical protein